MSSWVTDNRLQVTGKRRGLLQDKRGEKLLSIYWFFILGLVAVAVVSGLFIFFTKDIDVRFLENNILSENIRSCLIENGKLNDNFTEMDIYFVCNLDNESFLRDSKYYFRVELLGADLIRSGGGAQLRKECEITKTKDNEDVVKAKYFADCLYTRDAVQYSDNREMKDGILEVLIASQDSGNKITGGQDA